MAFTTQELADATVSAKKALGKHASWAAAAEKALKGKGIFNPLDIKRRKGEILAALGKRGASVTNARRSKQRRRRRSS